jgi:hypothetical protein
MRSSIIARIASAASSGSAGAATVAAGLPERLRSWSDARIFMVVDAVLDARAEGGAEQLFELHQALARVALRAELIAFSSVDRQA